MVLQAEQNPNADLRDQLITAGLEILEEAGLSGLTLRACAQRCGVSHAAPAHHFAGFPGLLSGIATRGFEALSAAMVSAKAGEPADPFRQLVGICNGYLRFAHAHPALFTLMFNAAQKVDRNADLKAASHAAYVILKAACEPFETRSRVEGNIETAVWSTVHGLASLQVGGMFRMPDGSCEPPEIEQLLIGLKDALAKNAE